MIERQRKKILYLLGSLRVGGTEQQVVETAIRLNRERFEAKLYCISGGGPLLSRVKRHSIDVRFGNVAPFGSSHARLFPLTWIKKLLRLYWYLKRERPDIIHAYLFTPSMYAGIASRFTGKPVFISSRRCLGLFKDDLHAHYQSIENMLNRWTDKILVNSGAVKEAVLRREHVDERKIYIIHNGVDLNTFRPIEEQPESLCARMRHAFGIPEQSVIIGMVANLISYKGYHDFITAAADVLQQHPDTQILCIGEDRGLQQELEQLAQHLGIRNHVTFTGRVDSMAEVLPMLDIQVSASHQEGFSNAILEGMACGKPIIGTAVGGTPEAVEDNVTGLLVPPRAPQALAQAMRALRTHPERALQMGQNGRKRVERYFSFKKMIDKLENLYLNFS